MIRKFGQLEFRHGSVERGKTLFENLVTSCPRRTDIWSVYIDVCVKFGDISQARFCSVTVKQLAILNGLKYAKRYFKLGFCILACFY